MTSLTILSAEVPLAQVFGLAGLAGQFTWPLLRNRNGILATQIGIAGSYATHYALLDQWSGMSVCLVGATQSAIALLAGDRPWLSRMGLGFIPVVITLCYLTWSGLPSLLAACACCLVMIGRMQRDMLRMRAIMLSASPFGIGHDLIVGAVAALAGAVLSCAIGAAALRREWIGHSRAAMPG
ncbi:YgjV family protein [Tropicimonas sediminicola]|uniref:Inner membrane protein n=1 Tax=Tropicimonas sediminicola TaxID=1031541 RepID=A0A239FUG7_9RHOB|nr:YgjV family protein [Tropicimonas sediminicola]SNS60178.1 inner membrane protein [Tropicimonas sediminicola]